MNSYKPNSLPLGAAMTEMEEEIEMEERKEEKKRKKGIKGRKRRKKKEKEGRRMRNDEQTVSNLCVRAIWAFAMAT